MWSRASARPRRAKARLHMRQPDAELGAAAASVLQPERRVVIREDLLHEREAEAAPIAFRAEEWREEVALRFVRDTRTAVGDRQDAVAQSDVDDAVAIDRLH